MGMSFGSRLKHAWNIFFNKAPTDYFRQVGASYYHRPDRTRFSRGNERSIVNVINKKREKAEVNRTETTAEISQLRTKAAEVRAKIAEDLRAYLNEISDSSAKQKEELRAERDQKLEGVTPLPKSTSPEQKAKMRERNAKLKSNIN